MAAIKHQRTCEKGHTFFKSSDCPVCPVCESEKKPKTGFLSGLSAPARRVLENQGIDSLDKLSNYTEQEILKFHGIGPSSIPSLKAALKEQDMDFARG